MYADISKQLLDKMSAEDALAALLEYGFKRDLSKQAHKKLNKVAKTESNQSGYDKLFIALGKSDSIDEEGLINFLSKETSIEKELFIDIKIFDTFSFFMVPTKDAEIVLEIFRRKNVEKDRLLSELKVKTPAITKNQNKLTRLILCVFVVLVTNFNCWAIIFCAPLIGF